MVFLEIYNLEHIVIYVFDKNYEDEAGKTHE